MPDYATLQKQALASNGQDEAVTVNQRALIDKILARYASDNTTLRELLQNADDANATLVKIHYMTLSSDPVPLENISSTPCRRLQVSNNGTPFRPEDWTRLKRIAEGNPDAEKIGAFGVGFYSVFSICDDPFVSSGKECMAFYWNDRDQLFVRRRELDQKDDVTTFMLNMRTPTEIPQLPELCRFLATSLTFTRSLSSIELHFDNYKLLTLHRQAAPDTPMVLHPTTLNLISPKRSMQLKSAILQPIQIKAIYLAATQHLPIVPQTGFKKLFSRFKDSAQTTDLSAEINAIAFLRIATAKLSISIGPKFAAEFERAQKKPPPRETKIHMLCISKAEFDASTHNDPVFSDLIPRKQGRVYIGFPTHQTTGFGGHIGAPALVPTVERESIDLADAQLRVWNGELLGCIGIFARILYNQEMENITLRVNPKTPDDPALVTEAIHLMNLFTFHNTTPSDRVRHYVEETFFSAAKDGNISLLTNKGIKPSNLIRIAPHDLSFLVNTPLLSDAIITGSQAFVNRLREGGLLKVATWEDVKAELNSRTLSETHAVQFLRWLLQEKLAPEIQRQLLSLAVVIVGDEKLGRIVNLGEVTDFAVPGRIPIDGGLPLTVLPLELGKTFSTRELQFFGWEELSVYDWVKHICTTLPKSSAFDIEKSKDFAITVVTTVSKNWESIPFEDRKDITSLLAAKKCMPTTKKGLLKPEETYFSYVKVLPDLPLVESMKGVKEKFLEQLGVRKVVALQLIFDRLGEGGDWSHIDGIKYLASEQNNLTAAEFQKLREYPLCPSRSDKKRMVVSQLYEPNSDLEKFELPILSWPVETWKTFSPEARFLYALGLNRYPSADTLIKMASLATATTEQRNRALDYFTTFYHTHEYNRTDLSKVKEAFLPSEPVDGKVFLCNPSDIYFNQTCRALGFYVIDRRFIADASKFGVKSDPSPAAIEGALVRRPPATQEDAREKFAYAAQRVSTFTKTQLVTLGRSKIVPVVKNGVIKHVPPYLCFIDKHQEKERVWEDIFDFVDFGDRANLFLEALGVKDTPDATQVADQLAREPKRIYQAMDMSEYLRLLSTLGNNITSLQRDRTLWAKLKEAPFLIGTTFTVGEDGSNTSVATLARAQDIVIVDEPRLGVIFRGELIVAPERDDCEALYLALGAPHLSTLVRQKYRYRGSPTKNAATERLEKHIIERSGIFLTLPEIAPNVKKTSFLASNLRIYAYESIQVERSLVFGRIRSTVSEDVTAVVDTSAKGCLLIVTNPSKVNFNQVAEGLNSVLLKKTNRGTDLMFEMIMKENLEFLRFRGFPVDRLLNRHLEEQRLAKAKQEAAEQERRKEEESREKQKAEQAKAEAERLARETQSPGGQQVNGAVPNGIITERPLQRTPKPKIPGAWQDDHPENDEPPAYTPQQPQPRQTEPDRRTPGFLSSIKNALGLPDPLVPGTLSQQVSTQRQPSEPQAPHYPTSKASIDNQLANAIRAVRPFNQNSIFQPATSTMVHEAPQSYCDTTEAQDLQLYSHSPPWGLETFFVPHGQAQFDTMISQRVTDVHQFSGLLIRLAKVYNVRVDSFHLFFDPKGRTIAFNRRGSLFFNIAYTTSFDFANGRYYLELHAQEGGYSREAPIYWFTVIAHELAHNMVHPHGAEHSYWTEAFVTSYMLVLWENFK